MGKGGIREDKIPRDVALENSFIQKTMFIAKAKLLFMFFFRMPNQFVYF